ncbi:MAG TPA: F0F1 ATP synthase subunit B [Burkholderiales bacterium]|nr:F0F1 ATP synthase subunit B [Burkholderiales bacterium]
MSITVTLIAQMVAFILLIWFVNRVLWGPLSKLMADRQTRIADGLAAAERGKQELDQAARRVAQEMDAAKGKAAEIIAHAEKRASEIIEDARDSARGEGDRILAGAKAEIDQQVNRAKESLRDQVTQLAVAGAEKILRREVDAKTHADLLSQMQKELH